MAVRPRPRNSPGRRADKARNTSGIFSAARKYGRPSKIKASPKAVKKIFQSNCIRLRYGLGRDM